MAAYDREFVVTHTLKHIYKMYVEKRLERKQPVLSHDQFKKVSYEFLKRVANLILEEGFEYKIPHRMGYLRIKATKIKYKIKDGRIMPKKGIIDWGECRKLWYELYPGLTLKEIKLIKDKPLVFYTNEHTNGEVYRWYWDKHVCTTPNHSVYTFEPVKQNRLKLKNIVKDENFECKFTF